MNTPENRAIRSINAWLKLMETLFSKEDRVKVEWAIGCVFAGGPKKILLVSGPASTGKSTVLKLARTIFSEGLEPRLRVVIRQEGATSIDTNAFMFVASNVPAGDSLVFRGARDHLIEARTTGHHVRPTEYLMLIGLIGTESETIAHYCLGRYRELGAKYYDIEHGGHR